MERRHHPSEIYCGLFIIFFNRNWSQCDGIWFINLHICFFFFVSFISDAPKSQCSSLSDGESFECFGESESTDNNKNGEGGVGVGEIVIGGRGQLASNMSSRLSQSMMSNGNGINQQPLSPMTSDSSGGDPELSINSSNGNNGYGAIVVGYLQ